MIPSSQGSLLQQGISNRRTALIQKTLMIRGLHLHICRKYSEDIEAVFNNDNINIKLRSSKSAPVAYIMSNNLMAKAIAPEKPLPPIPKPEPPVVKPIPPIIVKPEPPVKPPPKRRVSLNSAIQTFQHLLMPIKLLEMLLQGILDKETAEYVTSRYVYAQAFTVEDAMTMHSVSLAMRKFGGDGTLYIDVVKMKTENRVLPEKDRCLFSLET